MVVTGAEGGGGGIAARPGRLSVLAVSVQVYGRPEIVRYVPAASFYPASRSRLGGPQGNAIPGTAGG